MRFNFRRIASAAASAAMVGSTIALAAAASWPAPYVEGGQADVAAVYGSNLDLAAVTDLTSSLSAAFAEQGGGSGAPTEGDFVQIGKSNDMFNLGEAASAFTTSYDSDDLSVVLADGAYSNDANEEFDYDQEVSLGASLILTHFADNEFNDEEPVIGFNIANGDHILNYTLDFTPTAAEGGTNWNDFEGTTIDIMGKEYYILAANNASGGSLDLLDSANTVVIGEGETETVQAGDQSYTISLNFIGTNQVKLEINGEVTPVLNEDDTYKLSSGDYVGIREILVQDYAGGVKQVEFSIGSGKIELIHGDEVQLNGEDISDSTDHVLNTYFTSATSGADLDQFVIEWNADDEMWLAFDTDSRELAMPAFGGVQLSLGEFVTEAEEVTSVDPDSDDKFKLTTELTDGTAGFNFLYANATDLVGIGKDADELLLTNSTDDPTIEWTTNARWFVATWISGDDHESYLLEVSDIDDSDADKNVTTIRSVATGSNQAVTLDIGETDEIGQLSFTLNAADEDDETASITITSGTGTAHGDMVVTAEGLKVQLPYAFVNGSQEAGDGMINFTAGDVDTWDMNFTEETEDGDINDGESLTATLSLTSSETTVTSITEGVLTNDQDYETSDGSDDFAGHIESPLATRTLLQTGGDQDSLDLTYYGSEAYGEVFLAETGVTSGGELGTISVMDDELSGSGMANRNLILVGGSCVNSVTAEVLGLTFPTCGPNWESATDVGAGEWMIEVFANPNSASKIATVVAGYEQGDTLNAATALRTLDTIDITEGNKYVGTTADAATPVVEEA